MRRPVPTRRSRMSQTVHYIDRVKAIGWESEAERNVWRVAMGRNRTKPQRKTMRRHNYIWGKKRSGRCTDSRGGRTNGEGPLRNGRRAGRIAPFRVARPAVGSPPGRPSQPLAPYPLTGVICPTTIPRVRSWLRSVT